jgi:hypothetical protein
MNLFVIIMCFLHIVREMNAYFLQLVIPVWQADRLVVWD